MAGDVWHRGKDPKAYEWWYFDALSDDGKDAVAISFLDNFVYSSGYNRTASRSNSHSHDVPVRFPAISFIYFENGRTRYRSVIDYPSDAFEASDDKIAVRIGDCSLNFQRASYGSGYLIEIDVPLSGDRRLTARFEWLLIESDLLNGPNCTSSETHCWNVTAPRSDVSGKVAIFDRKGTEVELLHFRGTGYHDHKLDSRWMATTVRDWYWGRAHFNDSTAVFCRYREYDEKRTSTKLLLVRNGELKHFDAGCDETGHSRDKLGISISASFSICV